MVVAVQALVNAGG